MQRFQDVLEGKVKLDELTDEELPEYRKFAQAAAVEEQQKVTGLREAKRAEQEKIDRLKEDAAKREAEAAAAGQKPPENPEMKQFRDEQIIKAKNRLYSNVTLSDEEKTKVEEKFSKLDSGKLDSDLIYEDLLSAVAAANPQKFISLSKEKEEAERAAQEELARQAGGSSSGGGSSEPKKYSDEVVRLSKEANIDLEAAKRQVEQGTKRVY